MVKPVNYIKHCSCHAVMGLFMLFAAGVSAGPEIEPNDNFGYANLLLEGESIEGRLDNADDVDWFKLPVPAGTATILDIALTSTKKTEFPYNLGGWKIFVYDPDGKLVDEYTSDLKSPASVVFNSNDGGDYLVAIDNDGLSLDDEYSLAFTTTDLAQPPYSDFSGIWNTGQGYYISAHQSADQLIFTILYADTNSWDVHEGTVVGNTVTTRTYAGAVSVSFDVTMTSPSTLEAEQVSCQPAEDCRFVDGTVIYATRIIQ